MGRCSERKCSQRRLHEVATLNGQQPASLNFNMDFFFTAFVYTNLSTRLAERNFPKRLLYMVPRTFLYERSLRTGEMVRDSIQPTCSMFAGCAMEREWFFTTPCRVPTILSLHTFLHLRRHDTLGTISRR